MPSPPSVLRQLLPVVLLLLSLSGTVRSNITVFYLCPPECGTFTSGDTYASNLKNLLDDMYSSTPFKNYTNSYGVGAYKAFATARCDNSTFCSDCIYSTILFLAKRCSGMSVATALVDTAGCKLQYANCDSCYLPFELPDNYNGTWPPPGYVPPLLPSNCLGGDSPPSPPSRGYPPPVSYPPPMPDSPPPLYPSPPLRQQHQPPPQPPSTTAGAGDGSGTKTSDLKMVYILPPIIVASLVLGAIFVMFLVRKTQPQTNTGTAPPAYQNAPWPPPPPNAYAGNHQQFPGQWSPGIAEREASYPNAPTNPAMAGPFVGGVRRDRADRNASISEHPGSAWVRDAAERPGSGGGGQGGGAMYDQRSSPDPDRGRRHRPPELTRGTHRETRRSDREESP